jgi:uncharacterized membrane protein
MNQIAALAVAAGSFVGTHFLLSHPLRKLMVERMGEGPFRGAYTLVSFVTFGLTIWIYYSIGRQQPLWTVGELGSVAATLLMWLGAILFAGSFVGNPALPGTRGPKGRTPSGVMAITRHPMMWGFALWAVVHAMMIATPKALILDASILFLALVGSMMQDRKKRALMGADWHDWTAQTAFFPFAGGLKNPGLFAFAAGTALFLIGTWLHPFPVGVWHWIS